MAGFWTEEILEGAEKPSGFSAIPAGDYRVMLTDSEIKPTKAGGQYLNTKFELHGNQALDGRVLFHKFNLVNDNPKAVSIGMGQLKELSEAVGRLDWYEDLKTSTSWEAAVEKLNTAFASLGNKHVEVKVVVKTSEQYGEQNDIKRFKATSADAPAPAAEKKKGAAAANPWD